MLERENFDYTKWQRQYFDNKTDEELRRDIKDYLENHPYKGKAQVI